MGTTLVTTMGSTVLSRQILLPKDGWSMEKDAQWLVFFYKIFSVNSLLTKHFSRGTVVNIQGS